MLRYAAAAVLMGIALTGCSGGATATHPSTPKPVPTSALGGLLLDPADINTVMGTTAMTPLEPFSQMQDQRNLLPNLNCLGIWSIGQTAIYGPSGFTAVRGQQLREPDLDNWNSLVIEGVVSYQSPDAAKKFFAESSDRWSKCSNHRVNLTFTGHPQTTWMFGALTKTDSELTMPVTRSGDDGRSCQRALAVVTNLVMDVAACAQSPVTDQAATIVGRIQSKIPA